MTRACGTKSTCRSGIVSAGTLGYYRVLYDEGMWAKLSQAVNVSNASTDGLQEADYAELLDDAAALSEAGLTPVPTFLNLTRSPPPPLLCPFTDGFTPAPTFLTPFPLPLAPLPLCPFTDGLPSAPNSLVPDFEYATITWRPDEGTTCSHRCPHWLHF